MNGERWDSEFIRCPRRLCSDPKKGWIVRRQFRNGLSEYICHNCGKKFYFNARSRRMFRWHKKYSTLKYLLFANESDEVVNYMQTRMGKIACKTGILPERNPKECDFILVLGGDGAMLQAVHSFAECGKPFLGINLGHRGFLLNPSNEFSFERMYNEEYAIFCAPLLLVTATTTRGDRIKELALNDITVHEDVGQSAWLKISVNDETLSKAIRGDGVIISTPLGSTAYTANAGGAAILPTSPVFELTPLAVEPKNRLPIVIPNTSTIRITVLELPKRGARISQGSIFRHSEIAEIEIKKADMYAQIVFFKAPEMSWDVFFLRRLSEKIFIP